jgi:ectoine hydroxylase-related dioxygenase (phytanoyl-CoA dioxygenase family)
VKWLAQYTGFLRTIRVLYWLNNLKHRKKLYQNKSIYKAFGIKRSVLKSLDSRILKPFVGDIKSFHPKGFDNSKLELTELQKQWARDGFVLLSGFVSEAEVETINTTIEDAISNEQLHFNYTQRKIFNAHRQIPAIAAIAQHPELLKLLEELMGKPAIHFQTINFNVGSEQKAHSDSIHMTTLPLGYLAGVWVALEEINADNGPLTYYPGSHLLPYVLNGDYDNSSSAFFLDGNANEKYERYVEKVVADSGLKPLELQTQPGDVLIWHANLLHGGAPIKNAKLTRKSMVFHYFAKGVLCFHEISERPAIIE